MIVFIMLLLIFIIMLGGIALGVILSITDLGWYQENDK